MKYCIKREKTNEPAARKGVLRAAFVLAAALLLAASASCIVFADGSGGCGANLTWKLDSAGTLTIEGTGEMDNYALRDEHAPWYRSSGEIRKVVIKGGVTSIGDHAFHNCNNLQEIDIAEGVVTIGESAMLYCSSIRKIDLPKSVRTIRSFAFSGAESLETLIIRENVQEIGSGVTEDCVSLKRVHYTGDADRYEENVICDTDWEGHLEFEHGNGWDKGKITRAATCTQKGVRTYTCTVCGDTRTESLPVDPNAHDYKVSVKKATIYAAGLKKSTCTRCGDTHSEVIPRKAYTPKPVLNSKVKVGKKSATITWNKVKGADRYVIYLSKCDGKRSIKKLSVRKAGATSLKTGKLDSGKYYKFRVVAEKKVNGKYTEISRSVAGHFATKSNKKFTNPKKIGGISSKLTLKVSGSKKLKGKVTKEDGKKKLITHAKVLRYQTSDRSIASVDKTGKVKGMREGKCTIYVIAQNGLAKKVSVTVK